MQIINKFRGTGGLLTIGAYALRLRYMITEQAKQRVRILTFWEKHGDEATKEAFTISRRTLFRWQRSLKNTAGNLEGLNARTTAPKRRRTRGVPLEIVERIITLRTAHPRLGKDKLYALLLREGHAGSISTVGRILSDLKKAHRLPDPHRYSLSARTGRMIERTYTPRTKLRRPKGYRVLEVDTVVRFVDGVKRYILTGIDTEKRTAFAGCYTNHGSKSAADFLLKASTVLPDCPRAIQTDNGSEFALHFAKALQEAEMTHFHTYPRSPKMNAHVERFNRTLDEEFLRFHRSLLRDDIRAFNEKLVEWLLWYNGERPHHALGQVSPFRSMMTSLSTEECQRWWTDTTL